MDPITIMASIAMAPMAYKLAGVMIAASWLGFWAVWQEECRKQDEEGE